MDPVVLQIVSGRALSELQIFDAVAPGYVQREVVEESYPILVAQASQQAHGQLIFGLDEHAMDRIQFFEGDEYALDTLPVLTDSGTKLAHWFRDTGAYQDTGNEWSFSTWREHAYDAFIDMAESYMQLYGTMTATEADTHWQSLIASRPQSVSQ